MRRVSMFIALLIPLLAAPMLGCGAQRAQAGTRTALTTAGEGVRSVDRIIAVDMEEARDEILDGIRADCPAPPEPCPGALERYRAEMDESGWAAVPRAHRSALESLAAVDNGVEVWINTGNLSESWGPLCEEAGEACEHLIGAVEAATEEDAPAVLQGAPAAVAGACQLAEPFIQREQVSGDSAGDKSGGGSRGDDAVSKEVCHVAARQ